MDRGPGLLGLCFSFKEDDETEANIYLSHPSINFKATLQKVHLKPAADFTRRGLFQGTMLFHGLTSQSPWINKETISTVKIYLVSTGYPPKRRTTKALQNGRPSNKVGFLFYPRLFLKVYDYYKRNRKSSYSAMVHKTS